MRQLTTFESRVILAIGYERFAKPGWIAGRLGMEKRKPQAYARITGAALNRLRARGLVQRTHQPKSPGQYEDWGWQLTTKGGEELQTIARFAPKGFLRGETP